MFTSAFIPPNTSEHPALRNTYAMAPTGLKPSFALSLKKNHPAGQDDFSHLPTTGGLFNEVPLTAGFAGPSTTKDFTTTVPTTGITTGGPYITTGPTTGSPPTTTELTTPTSGYPSVTTRLATGRGKPTIGSKVSTAVEPFAIQYTRTKESLPEVVTIAFDISLSIFFAILDFGMEFDGNNPGTMPQDYPSLNALYQFRDFYTYTKMAWDFFEQVEILVILKFLAQARRSAKKIKGILKLP